MTSRPHPDEEEVKERMVPFQNGAYDDIRQVDDEIRAVARLLTDVAKRALPLMGGKGGGKKWLNFEVPLCPEQRSSERLEGSRMSRRWGSF